jgi:hypothetical protein
MQTGLDLQIRDKASRDFGMKAVLADGLTSLAATMAHGENENRARCLARFCVRPAWALTRR